MKELINLGKINVPITYKARFSFFFFFYAMPQNDFRVKEEPISYL